MNFITKSRGFSLIEVLIALVILAISLLALAGLMATTARNNSFGGHITEASTFAQDKLEEFRAMRWDDVQTTPPGLDTDNKSGATGINYTRNWNVAQNGNIKTITITINWNDRTDHSMRLISAISK
jgi:type IV pilus assembly protein PilV